MPTWLEIISKLAVALAFVLPLLYVIQVGSPAKTGTALRPDERSRANYFDALRTLVTAAGVAIAIVAAGLQQKFVAPTWILKTAAGCLALCVMFSVSTMLVMSRVYEKARTDGRRPATGRELTPVLVLGYGALVTFLLGFIHLALLTFYIGESPPPSHGSLTASELPASHFVIAQSAPRASGERSAHTHTFLLDEATGAVWQMFCVRDSVIAGEPKVQFRRVSVEGRDSTPAQIHQR
jgi:hypothetical protein